MAQAMNLQAGNGTGTGKRLGWLVWWTIEGKDLPTQDVIDAAIAAKVPQWLIDRINGRGEKASWMVATQTGTKGIERPRTASDPLDATVRYMTKDVNPTCRAIVREVLDPAAKIVGSVTVAQVFFTTDPAKRFQWIALPSAGSNGGYTEVDALIHDMVNDYQARIGLTDYSRIRALIIDWLLVSNRVTVRGSGGVYLIPRPKVQQEADRVQAELVSLANWIGASPIASLFSIVEVSDQGATTVATFQKAAIDELKAELNDVDQKLSTWAKNPNMNAGSMAYSAGTMLDRVDELAKRVDFLVDSLGEEIAVVQIAMNAVMKRAKNVQFAAQHEVETYQAQKVAAKTAAKTAPEAAQTAPVASKTPAPVKTPAKPVPAPSVPLKPVEAVQSPDQSITLIKNWEDVKLEQAATQVKNVQVKPQAGSSNGKKAGVTSKAAKKL